jgi:hypothetical protein
VILGLAVPSEFQICGTEKHMAVFVRAGERELKKLLPVSYFPDLN